MILNSARKTQLCQTVYRLIIKNKAWSYPMTPAKLMALVTEGVHYVPYSSLSAEEKKIVSKKSKDGFGIILNNDIYIYYNDNMPERRVLFTLAHEIAHVIAGHYYKQDIPNDVWEAEADFIASQILMPNPCVDKLNPYTSEEIYIAFGVSKLSASITLQNLFYRQKYTKEYSPFEIIIYKMSEFTQVSQQRNLFALLNAPLFIGG